VGPPRRPVDDTLNPGEGGHRRMDLSERKAAARSRQKPRPRSSTLGQRAL
jgi:hypothetical protein